MKSIASAVTTNGQRAPIKFRRERNGKYTAMLDVSGINGIQFDARHDSPLVELPAIDLRSEGGVIFGHENISSGAVIDLHYDSGSSEYSACLHGQKTTEPMATLTIAAA